MTQDNKKLLEKIVKFANNAHDISFLGLIGSASNRENVSDIYSDIDLVVVTSNVAKYFNDGSWLSGIDEVWGVMGCTSVC